MVSPAGSSLVSRVTTWWGWTSSWVRVVTEVDWPLTVMGSWVALAEEPESESVPLVPMAASAARLAPKGWITSLPACTAA